MSSLFETTIKAIYRGDRAIEPFIGTAYTQPLHDDFRVLVLGFNTHISEKDYARTQPRWFAGWFRDLRHRFFKKAHREGEALAKELAGVATGFERLCYRTEAKAAFYVTNAIKEHKLESYKRASKLTAADYAAHRPQWHDELRAMTKHGVFPHLFIIYGEEVWHQHAWKALHPEGADYAQVADENFRVLEYLPADGNCSRHAIRLLVEVAGKVQPVLLLRLSHPAYRNAKVAHDAQWLLRQQAFRKLVNLPLVDDDADGELPSDPLSDDTAEPDLASQVLDALIALRSLGRPSTSADRSGISVAQNLPRGIWSRLGRWGAIAPPAGQNCNAGSKLRDITDKGTAWLSSPSLIFVASQEDSGYIGVIHNALAAFAVAEGLPVGKTPYILRSKDHWASNLWMPLQARRHLFPDAKDLHRWVHHLRSSQAFAFNLFGPLAASWRWAASVWEPIFGHVRHVRFEYPTDGEAGGDDPLGERTDERPHRTRVDVRIDHGIDEVTLVEVKLTESEFGGCSAARSAANQHRATCGKPGLRLDELAASCYLVLEAKRSYFRRLNEPHGLMEPSYLDRYSQTGCPFRGGLYQIGRNLMIAQYIREGGAPVHFAVAAPGPELNPSLHGSRSLHGNASLVSFVESVVRHEDRAAVRFIDMVQVLDRAAAGDGDAQAWASYMRRKYVEPLRLGAAARKAGG